MPRLKILSDTITKFLFILGVEHTDVISTAEGAGLSVTSVDDTVWRKGIVCEYSPPDDFNRAQVYRIVRKV